MNSVVKLATRDLWESLLQRYPVGSVMDRRRKDPRRRADQAKVRLFYRTGTQTESQSGRLLNLSSGGVLLQVSERIRVGRPVILRLALADGHVVLAGRVVHCTEATCGFKVGIELQFEGD